MMPYDDEEARYSTPGVVGQGHVPGEYGYSAGNVDEYGDEPENYIRYGRIPQRVPRRLKTIKRVEWVFFSRSSLHCLNNIDLNRLFHGNYVYDAPVPSKLLALCSNRSEREFTLLRYTGATCDPNDFMEEGFTLRQVLYDPPRRTELFIVMTMYNEDEELFCRCVSSSLILLLSYHFIFSYHHISQNNARSNKEHSPPLYAGSIKNMGKRRMEEGGCLYSVGWETED